MNNNHAPTSLDKKIYIYKSNNISTILVRISFGLFNVICLIVSIVELYLLQLVSDFINTESDAVQQKFIYIANFHDNLLITSKIIFIVCGIIFLFWIYRANKNAHALLENSKFKYTPGWAVGSFFIPFLNFVWPYRAVKEIWVKSVCDASDNKTKFSALVLIWWLTYLSFFFISRIVAKMPIDTISELQSVIVVNIITNISGVAAGLMAIIIVRKINQSQIMLKRIKLLEASPK